WPSRRPTDGTETVQGRVEWFGRVYDPVRSSDPRVCSSLDGRAGGKESFSSTLGWTEYFHRDEWERECLGSRDQIRGGGMVRGCGTEPRVHSGKRGVGTLPCFRRGCIDHHIDKYRILTIS
ncbi:hypothetical protein RSAG8_09186, partial [Rhizoctonia solani AG-8 WAC10335]